MDLRRHPVLVTTILSVASLVLLLVAFSRPDTAPAPAPPPTVRPEQHIIFYNGTILTMDDAQPRAQALAIEGERIAAVGDDDVVLAGKRADTMLIDLEGRTLMPGFVDAHTHLLNDAEQYFDMSLDEVQQVALENGITTIGNMYTNEAFLDEISEVAQSGRLRLRTSLYLVATDNCGRSEGDWWQAHSPTRSPGEMLRIGGVKVFTDGGTCERPALTYETEPGAGLGDLFLTQQALNDLVSAVQGTGHQVAIHAIGDRAVEQAQNAIEAALDGQPNTWRHRIEHNSVLRPELLPRYGELGIVPVIFGQYPTCEPFGTPPAAYEAWEWPWRALLDANPGLPIAWHGDDPFFGRVRPLDDLYSLVTRNEVAADGTICRAPAWQAQHTITAAEALPMMTRHAAYALFRETEVGSLEPGMYADLIVLSADPLSVAPEDIPGIQVQLTMVGGRVEHCAPNQTDVCP